MNDILGKKVSEITVLEMVEASYLNWVSQNPTMEINDFCRMSGKDRRRINKLISNRLIPEHLIVGGYRERRQRTKIYFITENVIEWLKNR